MVLFDLLSKLKTILTEANEISRSGNEESLSAYVNKSLRLIEAADPSSSLHGGDKPVEDSASRVDTLESTKEPSHPDIQMSSFPEETYDPRNDSEITTSSESSSEDEYPEDISLLPALSPTEPRLLQYHKESEDLCLPDLVPCSPDKRGCHSHQCEFCGHTLSTGNTSSCSDSDSSCSSDREPDINTDYCCRDRRKFTHLIAKYTKKLSSSTNYKVAKIDISPGKKALKSIAKERALARLKAKKLQKQRELKLLGIGGSKVLQSSSFYSLARQTKTINFSLSEANSVQETWILERDKHGGVLSDGPTVGKSDAGPLKPVRRQRRKNKMADAEEDELTMWLRQQEISQPSLLPLKILWYNENSLFRICHRNGTGQCYYPSGNAAIVATAISPGVMAYMVLTDQHPPQQRLLAYFDDLGRGFCYFEKNLQIRLSYGGSEGCVLNEKGLVRKKWLWSDESAFVQPTVLNVNSHVVLRIINQSNLVLTLTIQPQFIAKFQVGRKLSPPMIQDGDFKQLEYFEESLKSAKLQLS
jgi:ribosomal protein L28